MVANNYVYNQIIPNSPPSIQLINPPPSGLRIYRSNSIMVVHMLFQAPAPADEKYTILHLQYLVRDYGSRTIINQESVASLPPILVLYVDLRSSDVSKEKSYKKNSPLMVAPPFGASWPLASFDPIWAQTISMNSFSVFWPRANEKCSGRPTKTIPNHHAPTPLKTPRAPSTSINT